MNMEFILAGLVTVLYVLAGNALFNWLCLSSNSSDPCREMHHALSHGKGRERRAASVMWVLMLLAWPFVFGFGFLAAAINQRRGAEK